MRALLLPLFLISCASNDVEDVGIPTNDAAQDAGVSDVGGLDAAADASIDAGAGFGGIAGACGVVQAVLTSSVPAMFQNSIDFGNDPYDESDAPRLTEGGREIIRDGNAGGSSLYSEVFAYEVLHRCEGAELLKTETEIDYVDPQGKITDLLVSIDAQRVGVSVTRAVTFPRDATYTLAQAQDLLENKLQGVLDSTANVASSDGWVKQILHVIAYAPPHAETLEDARASIDPMLLSDTIIYVTVSEGDDDFLY